MGYEVNDGEGGQRRGARERSALKGYAVSVQLTALPFMAHGI
jgi:hypothetical protein